MSAQRFIGKNGVISFFSEAPLEDISAKNKKVSAAFDDSNNQLAFLLLIDDFIFPNALMQEHFNENYLESDIFPKSNFIGTVLEHENGKAIVDGYLTIHGKKKRIKVEGYFKRNRNIIVVSASFRIKLKDYDIKIPKLMMYKISEEVVVFVDIDLKEVR